MPDEILDATAASSSATTDAETGSSAETQNTGTQPAPSAAEVPFHQHPRWQQVIGENRQLKTVYQDAMRRIEQLEAAAKPKDEPPSREYQDAAEALLKIMRAHPELNTLLSLSKAAPTLVQGYQGVQQLTRAQQEGLQRQGRAQIRELAKTAELPQDQDSLDLIEEMVAGVVRRMPDGVDRWKAGDLDVVREAFDKVQKGFLASLRRDATTTLTQTKQQTKKLPPAPRGAPSGGEAPPKLEKGKEREYFESVLKRGRDRLGELLAG